MISLKVTPKQCLHILNGLAREEQAFGELEAEDIVATIQAKEIEELYSKIMKEWMVKRDA